jgi:hypothetical protein
MVWIAWCEPDTVPAAESSPNPVSAARIGGRGPVQPGQRGVRILAQPCLEKPGERERQRLAWLGAGKPGEVAVPLGVRAGRREPGGEDDRGVPVGAGPAGRRLE